MTARQILDGLQRDWTTLGNLDPLWAVCVDPDRRGGRWDLDEFLASGRAEIDAAMGHIDRLRLCEQRAAALDFGCGVGRLTVALARHFDAVTGVDIAPSMLDRARAMHSGDPRCRFVHNDSPNLGAFGDGSFDLVYSSLVLQHMAPKLARSYLAEFVRVVRPGGAIALVVPQAHLRTARGLVYAVAPQAVIGWLQRGMFGYPAAMRMHTVPARRIASVTGPLGGRLVQTVPHHVPGAHWQMAAHFIAVQAGAPHRAPTAPS